MKTRFPENAAIDRKLKVAFDQSYDGIRELGRRDPSEKEHEVPLQGVLLNLMEMAAYTTGLPYEKLEGLQDPWGDLHLSPSSWFLVGKTPFTNHRFPKEIALAELDSLGKKHPEAILFRLGENPHWKRADSSEWKTASEQNLRLIAGALEGEKLDELKKHVVGEQGLSDAFRQARIRARRDLRQMLGRDRDYQPLPDSPPDSPNRGVTVADDLLIFGAVNDATFRKVPERND
jgi:hypothetical protein